MAAQQQVALDELTVEQLSQVKQQLDEVCLPLLAYEDSPQGDALTADTTGLSSTQY